MVSTHYFLLIKYYDGFQVLEGKNGMFKLSMARHGEDFFNQINFVKSSITLAPLPKRTTIVVFFSNIFPQINRFWKQSTRMLNTIRVDL